MVSDNDCAPNGYFTLKTDSLSTGFDSVQCTLDPNPSPFPLIEGFDYKSVLDLKTSSNRENWQDKI